MPLCALVFNLVKFFYLYGKKYDVIDIIGGFNDLDLSKKRMVFSVNFRGRKLIMKKHPMSPIILKKNPVFLSVTSIGDFLNLIKENEIDSLQLLSNKTKCTRKIFDHWDYPRIKIYRYCKILGETNKDYTLSWMDKF